MPVYLLGVQTWGPAPFSPLCAPVPVSEGTWSPPLRVSDSGEGTHGGDNDRAVPAATGWRHRTRNEQQPICSSPRAAPGLSFREKPKAGVVPRFGTVLLSHRGGSVTFSGWDSSSPFVTEQYQGLWSLSSSPWTPPGHRHIPFPWDGASHRLRAALPTLVWLLGSSAAFLLLIFLFLLLPHSPLCQSSRR